MPKNLRAEQGFHGRPYGRSAQSEAAIALTLRTLQAAADDHAADSPRPAAPDGFVFRRARAEVSDLTSAPERGCLTRILDAVEEGGSPGSSAAPALLELAGYLESHNRLREAASVLDLAVDLDPNEPELLLHVARVARKAGDTETARSLYDRVRRIDGSHRHLGRMAELGHALLEPDPERPLGRILRQAVRWGDDVAAAVAQEERARARRGKGDVAGALRDYMLAAARFSDPADLGRIGHEAADLLVLAGHPYAARRVLIEVERRALPRQGARARARLFDLSRTIGDEVGVRRWADAAPPSLVSLSPAPRRSGLRGGRAARVDAWIRRLDGV